MTGLVWRKVRSGGAVKLKRVPVVRREVLGGVGVVNLQRVRVICPACGQQVEAVARDGQVKGYCAVNNQSVDFLAETYPVPMEHPTAETKAKISAELTQVREGRDSSGRFVKGNLPRNKGGLKGQDKTYQEGKALIEGNKK